MDVEQRARELPVVARLYERHTARCTYRRASVTSAEGEPLVRLADAQALIAALTPPEGYVLVPTVLPEEMLNALYCAEGDMSDDDMQNLWQQLLAARPEVP